MEYTPIALSPGAMLHKGKFIGYVMRIRFSECSGDHLFYLRYDMVVELARALARKTHQMYLKGTFSTDESSQATLEMEKDYKQHDIYLTSDEISSPSVNNFVALLDYNVRDASLLLSLIKNDNSKIDISIPEAAVEIFTGYMMNTVIKAGGEALSEKLISDIGV